MKKTMDYEIVVALDGKNEAKGLFYIDDGDSYKYKRDNEYLEVEVCYCKGKLSFNYIQNGYKGLMGKISRISILGLESKPCETLATNVIYNEKSKTLEISDLKHEFGKVEEIALF